MHPEVVEADAVGEIVIVAVIPMLALPVGHCFVRYLCSQKP